MELIKPTFTVNETFPESISNFRSETKCKLERSLPEVINAERLYNC